MEPLALLFEQLSGKLAAAGDKALSTIGGATSQAANQLGGAVNQAANSIGSAGGAMANSLGQAGQQTQQIFQTVDKSVSQTTTAVKQATGIFSLLTDAASSTVASFTSIPAQLIAGVGDMVHAFADVPGQVAGAVTDIFQALVGIIRAPIDQIASAVGPFVQALSPSTMLAFQRALADLNATIGVALQPILQILTAGMRDLGGALLPIMERLRPLLELMAEQMVRSITPALELLGDALNTFLDVIEVTWPIAKELYEALIPLHEAARALFQTLVQFAGSFLGKVDWKGFIEDLRTGLQRAVSMLIVAIARMAQAFGALGFINNLASNLENFGKPPGPGAKAAGATSFQSFEQISKQFALAGFQAQGRKEDEKTDNQWLADLSKTLRQIQQQSPPDWKALIEEKVRAALKEWWQEMRREPPLSYIHDVTHKANSVGKTISDITLGPLAGPLLDPLGLMR